MKKTFLILILGLCLSTFVTPQVSNAQVQVGARFSPNSITYDSLMGDGESTVISQWSASFEAKAYPTNDLLVNLSYGFTKGTKINDTEFGRNQSVNGNNAKAAIIYNIFSATNLEVYVGLGFRHHQSSFNYLLEDDNNEKINLLKLSGNNFVGATQVNFILSNKALISANISGSPWFNWNYRLFDTTTHPPGSNWDYVIALEYDVNPDWSLSIGYAGGSGVIKEHTRTLLTLPEIQWSHSGFTASISMSF